MYKKVRSVFGIYCKSGFPKSRTPRILCHGFFFHDSNSFKPMIYGLNDFMQRIKVFKIFNANLNCLYQLFWLCSVDDYDTTEFSLTLCSRRIFSMTSCSLYLSLIFLLCGVKDTSEPACLTQYCLKRTIYSIYGFFFLSDFYLAVVFRPLSQIVE